MPIRPRNCRDTSSAVDAGLTPSSALFGVQAAVATIIAVVGTPSAAWAQSSVQLYGEIDTGVAYVSNVGGKSQYRLTSGTIDGSYWGCKARRTSAAARAPSSGWSAGSRRYRERA